MPRDLFFSTHFWRGICRRKWWSFSLHVTRSSSTLNFSDTFRLIALISMENKSNRNGPLPFLISAKQRRGSCYVLMLRLVDLIFLLWYASFQEFKWFVACYSSYWSSAILLTVIMILITIAVGKFVVFYIGMCYWIILTLYMYKLGWEKHYILQWAVRSANCSGHVS